MALLKVSVVSNESKIFEGEASFVAAQTIDGELGILPRHVPLMSVLKPGVLRIKEPGKDEETCLALSGGILEVQPSSVTVLAEVAVRGREADEQRALKAKRDAEEALKSSKNSKQTATAQAALAAAIAELKTIDYIRQRRH